MNFASNSGTIKLLVIIAKVDLMAGCNITINGIVQYTSGSLPYILLFTQAPILVMVRWYYYRHYSTILLTMYYSMYVMYV